MRKLYEDKDGISDVEILIIRHLKRDRKNDKRLKKLVGEYYLHVILNMLTNQ